MATLDVSTEQGCDLNERHRSLLPIKLIYVSVRSRVNDKHGSRAILPIEICTPHLAGLSLGSGEIRVWFTRQKWLAIAMEECLVQY